MLLNGRASWLFVAFLNMTKFAKLYVIYTENVQLVFSRVSNITKKKFTEVCIIHKREEFIGKSSERPETTTCETSRQNRFPHVIVAVTTQGRTPRTKNLDLTDVTPS